VVETDPDEDERASTDGGAAPSSTAESGFQNRRSGRAGDGTRLGTLWIRWTDGGSDLHLHRTCEIVPQVRRTSSFPWFEFVAESGERPTFEPLRADGDGTGTGERSETQFEFVSGLPRQLLRHVPFLILVATAILFISAEFLPGVRGISDLVPFLVGMDALLFGVYLAITPVLLWLLGTVDVFDFGELPEAVAIYGLVCLLAVGVSISTVLVFVADHPSEVEANVVLTSGYLLALLLGGMLLYEGVLRIEHLFVKLEDRDIVSSPEAYRRYLTDLYDALNTTTVLGVHPSRLFGLLFAGQFFIIYIIGHGPQGLGYAPGIVVNFVLNVVLVTVVFQFFVLVRYLNWLLSETMDYSEIGLRYEPFHVDGYGGFRDFGRFAIRINAILSLAGVYVLYRLYIVGGRNLPAEGLAGFGDPLTLAVWFINHIGPVVAYTLGVIAWGYYSFWSMHRKMAREKEEIARRYQGSRGSSDVDRTPSTGDSIDSFAEVGGPSWDAFRSAPTWPLEVNKMVSLLSGNALPFLLPVVNLFF